MVACLFVLPAMAVEVVRSPEPQQVFAAGQRSVEVRFHNAAAEAVRLDVRFRLLQLTSATAAPLGDARPWKSLNILPGQIIVETAVIEFPQVRVATRFAARWLDANGKLLGVTEIWAHPEDLLDTLKLLAGGRPIGLTDEVGMLLPALGAHGIPVRELRTENNWKEFRGQLALVLSKPGPNQGEPRLKPAALARAKEGLAVVWFQTPPTISPPMPRTAERVGIGRGVVVIASASTLEGFDHSPAAQSALVRLAELALSTPTQLLASRP